VADELLQLGKLVQEGRVIAEGSEFDVGDILFDFLGLEVSLFEDGGLVGLFGEQFAADGAPDHERAASDRGGIGRGAYRLG